MKMVSYFQSSPAPFAHFCFLAFPVPREVLKLKCLIKCCQGNYRDIPLAAAPRPPSRRPSSHEPAHQPPRRSDRGRNLVRGSRLDGGRIILLRFRQRGRLARRPGWCPSLGWAFSAPPRLARAGPLRGKAQVGSFSPHFHSQPPHSHIPTPPAWCSRGLLLNPFRVGPKAEVRL